MDADIDQMANSTLRARARELRSRAGRTLLRRRRLALGLVGFALVASLASASFAAFSALTDNDGNSVEAGTVTLQDNDDGSAVVGLADATPGNTDTGCIEVDYDGSLPATVRLYGSTSGTGLDQYLDLKVTRGTYTPSAPAFDSCTNFQADSTDYLGAGAGVIYDGTLQGFPDDYASGLSDPPESWATGEAHIYKIQVTLQSDFTAAGKNAAQAFTWEARNE